MGSPPAQTSPLTPVRYLTTLAVIALAYLAAARWGLAFWIVQGNVTLVWPPAGIALAALLLGGYRVLPAVSLGAFLATLATGAPLPFALAAALGNSLEALVGAYLLRRVAQFDPALARVRDVLALVLLGAMLSTTLSATICTGSLCALRLAPWSAFRGLWLSWWLGDALGDLIVAPVLLTWAARSRRHWPSGRGWEAAGFYVLLALASYIVYGVLEIPEDIDLPLAYAPFAFLIWATFRYGPRGAALATLVVCGIATVETASGRGPFVAQSLAGRLYMLCSFASVSALTTLFLSAVLAERDRAERAVRRARDELEARVRARTAELEQANAGLQAQMAERQRAEKAREQLAAAVEQAAEAILITDTTGRIEYVNPAYEQITGFSRAEIIGQTPRILYSGQHDAAFYRNLWETIRQGRTWTGRFVNRRKDGTLYQEDATISAVRDGTGRIINYVGVKRDVTREVALEAQLRQAQKMQAIGRLAGGLAHELNNVFAAILGHADVVAAATATDSAVYTSTRQVIKSAERGADLIRQLLAFSGQQVTQPRTLDLNRVVGDTVSLLRPLLGDPFPIAMCLDREPGHVRADPDQVQELLTSLALHAREAMPAGGRLKIETSSVQFSDVYPGEPDAVPPGRYVVLTVRDRGAGMDAETRVRLFEPFFTTRADGPFAGLGLASVYGIVQQNGGWIVVESAPDRGTTFKVYWPWVTAPLEAVPGVAKTAPRGAPATILVADDEAEVLELVRDFIAGAGCNVRTAANGTQALAVARQHARPFDLLVTDVVMPGLSGPELSAQLSQIGLAHRTLFISGYADRFLREHGGLPPGAAFLAKPFTRTALLEKVRELLNAAPLAEDEPAAVPTAETGTCRPSTAAN